MSSRIFFRAPQAFLTISMLGMIISCASFPSENQDPSKNNKATYNKDIKDCQEDYPQSGSGVHIRQWINCMNLKGWR
jgi:hypothetical protein